MDIENLTQNLYDELRNYLDEAPIPLTNLITNEQLYEFCYEYLLEQQIANAEFIRDDNLNEGIQNEN